MTVEFRAKISDRTSRVLGVIKEKYGLKDKAEALEKFTAMYGGEYVEYEMKEEALATLVKDCEKHYKKYGYKNMTEKELSELFKG